MALFKLRIDVFVRIEREDEAFLTVEAESIEDVYRLYYEQLSPAVLENNCDGNEVFPGLPSVRVLHAHYFKGEESLDGAAELDGMDVNGEYLLPRQIVGRLRKARGK